MNQTSSFFQTTLWNIINEMNEYSWLFAKNPQRDFTRKSKIGFKKALSIILSFGNKTLPNELLDYFQCERDTPSASAFVQCRDKILPDALKFLFYEFNSRCNYQPTYKGFRLLAIDGSELHIATNPKHKDSHISIGENKKTYNLLHLNVMYDVISRTYIDAVLQGKNVYNEQRALADMIEQSDISSAIVLADRGYESYNCFAHIQEKGWKFLFRVKDGTSGIVSGLDLPDSEEFDVNLELKLTRKQTKEVRELLKDRNHYKILKYYHDFDYLPTKIIKDEAPQFYHLRIRVVRFKLNDTSVETIITNLDPDKFSPNEIKTLYAKRWGIETSFRKIKYTIGLLYFHTKKVEYIYQEIFARMIIYNLTELVISHVVIEKKDRKYTYQANFSTATLICRQYFRNNISPPDVETLIARLILPIRLNRNLPRNLAPRKVTNFYYRVA